MVVREYYCSGLDGIKDIISGFLDWFNNTLVPAVKTVIDILGNIFNWLRDNVVTPVWNGIKGIIDGVVQCSITR